MRVRIVLKKGWDVIAEGEIKVSQDFLAGKAEAGQDRSKEAQQMLFAAEQAINASACGLRAHMELVKRK